MACCDPGDEIIVFDPTYANYLGFASIAGVHLAPVLSNMENNFALPAQSEIEKKITTRTRRFYCAVRTTPQEQFAAG